MLPTRRKRQPEPPDLFSGLSRIRRELEQFLNLATVPPLRSIGLIEGFWAPPIDVFEDKENIRVRAELPGMKREDIDLSIQGDTLIIQGERERQSEEKRENYHRVERNYGQFRRAIQLPSSVKADQIKATYQNGILEVVLPKANGGQQKRISVE